jgi:hypothetical protein
MSTGVDTPAITEVTGGVAGTSATYAAVRSLADRYDAAGDRMRTRAAQDAQVLVDPDLLASAPLSPQTFAEVEACVAAASTGLRGALGLSVACETDAALVRATVSAFEECDRLVGAAFDALDYTIGRDAGYAAPALALLGLTAASSWDRLPAGTRRRLEGELEDRAGDHPEVLQHGVEAIGGLTDGLSAWTPLALLGRQGFHPTAADAAADLASRYPPEGPPVVRRRSDLAVPLARTAPSDLAGLISHLAETNDLSPRDDPGDQGTIEVQTLRGPDGAVRHIVYLPGTDDLTTTPWHHLGSDVRDLPADLRVISGSDTTHADGIRQAMGRAGVGPHDPVLLVGHSLGGMEAASLLARGSGFDVTHVVTAGSPIAGIHDYPAGSHVLSLENRGDLVPLLDGHDNADSRSQVTVQFDDRETSIVGNHDLRHYVAGASAADTSTDPSVREQLESLRNSGFLGADATATSRVFQITR